MYNPNYKDLFQVMDDISFQMDEVIFLRYYDNFPVQYKYLFGLFSEAYRNVRVVCFSLSITGIVQGGSALRLLAETEAIIHIICSHQEVLIKYREHSKIREAVAMLSAKERKNKLKELFPDKQDNELLSYMDYGWMETLTDNKCNETELFKVAQLEDIINWKKNYLDKFAHISFLSGQFMDKNFEYPIINPLMYILCKLFDYLCCDFYAITSYEFIENNRDMFKGEFRKIYEKTNFE